MHRPLRPLALLLATSFLLAPAARAEASTDEAEAFLRTMGDDAEPVDDTGALFDSVGDDEQAAEAEKRAEAARAEAEKKRAAKAEADRQAAAKAAAEEAERQKAEAAKAAEAKKDAPKVADAGAPKKAPSPWTGSSAIYQGALTAISLDRGAEPMWNPYVGGTLILRPVYRLSETFSTSARFMASQEYTTPDDLTDFVVLGDLWADVSGRWKEPTTGIGVSGSLRLILPLSKASQMRTLIVGVSPGVTLTRNFDVLEGLSVRYLARYTQNFLRSTTGRFQGSILADCPFERTDCARFTHNGLRNAFGGIWHGPGVSLSVSSSLTFSVDFNMMDSFLFDLTPITVDGREVSTDGDQGVRYANYFIVDVSWDPFPGVTVDVGAWTFASQLGPDGMRRDNLFFNRETNLFVSLTYALGSGLGMFF